MSGYQVVNVGAPDAWRSFFGGFRPESSRDGRRVVDHELTCQFVGMTVNALLPGEEAGYWHTHSAIEEVYIFIAGQGQMGLDKDILEVRAGDIVRVGQDVMRTWRARPDSIGELRWICVRAGGTELPHFPDDSRRGNELPMPW